jgi:uncharacterized protein
LSVDTTLTGSLVRFGRVLRHAGLPIGTGRIMDALRGLALTGVQKREDVYWTLHSTLLTRREQQAVFDEAFHAFWRSRAQRSDDMDLLAAETSTGPKQAGRVAEALAAESETQPLHRQAERDQEVQSELAFSHDEALRAKDFEKMSVAELQAAKQALARFQLDLPPTRTRRWRRAAHGARMDLRKTLHGALRGGELAEIVRRSARHKPAPLVVLCDISGSMERYTRIFLHFVHGLRKDGAHVETFLFGTRLTRVTRQLRQRDIDVALAQTAKLVPDWAGGTRIGPCLKEFNLRWGRRVLGQGAMTLLVTDGLDRDDVTLLGVEAERLQRSSSELIWLNPLLRYAAFEAKAAGVRAILPHVDRFLPIHNLNSVKQLAGVLGSRAPIAKATTWK